MEYLLRGILKLPKINFPKYTKPYWHSVQTEFFKLFDVEYKDPNDVFVLENLEADPAFITTLPIDDYNDFYNFGVRLVDFQSRVKEILDTIDVKCYFELVFVDGDEVYTQTQEHNIQEFNFSSLPDGCYLIANFDYSEV